MRNHDYVKNRSYSEMSKIYLYYDQALKVINEHNFAVFATMALPNPNPNQTEPLFMWSWNALKLSLLGTDALKVAT